MNQKRIAFNGKWESLILLLKKSMKKNCDLSTQVLFKNFNINRLHHLKKFDTIYQCVNIISFDKKNLKKFKKCDDLNELLNKDYFYNVERLDKVKYHVYVIKRVPMNLEGFEFLAPICFLFDKKGYKFFEKSLFDKTSLSVYSDFNEFNFRLTEICLSYQKIIDLKEEASDKAMLLYDETKKQSKEMIDELKDN